MGVYKDEKRKSYYVSYSYRDPFSGAKRHVTKRGFRTKKEASEWELRSRLQNPIARGSDKLSFEEVAHQLELSVQASKEVEKKHQQHFQKRFSEFKDRAIQSISKADLMEWRNELARTDIYSTRTKNTTIAYVKGVFRYANEVYNYPNTASVLHSVKETNAEVMEEMEVWTPEEFDRFLAMVDILVYRLFFEFLFWTGCRRGEALALQKADVYDHCAVIRYSQRNAKDGLRPTKTKTVRKIRLDDQLWSDLTPLLQDRSQPYLFGGSTPLCPSPVQRQFTKAILKAGVKKIRIHDLRHSHATWLINSGVNIVAVSKRLGHADINQTLETYTHLLASTDQGMMDKLNEAHKETKLRFVSDTESENMPSE